MAPSSYKYTLSIHCTSCSVSCCSTSSMLLAIGTSSVSLMVPSASLTQVHSRSNMSCSPCSSSKADASASLRAPVCVYTCTQCSRSAQVLYILLMQAHQCVPSAASTSVAVVVAWTAGWAQPWDEPLPGGFDRPQPLCQSLAVLWSHSDSAPVREQVRIHVHVHVDCGICNTK